MDIYRLGGWNPAMKPVSLGNAPLPRTYARLLEDIKRRVRAAQVKAGLAVNRELVLVYWHIGHRILQAQRREGWGAKVVDRLAADLGRAFPQMRGFSPRNLKYMRAFAEAWPDESIASASRWLSLRTARCH
jgi:predicted nuclease of restriction endonuclease-like (RecB) superfamily